MEIVGDDDVVVIQQNVEPAAMAQFTDMPGAWFARLVRVFLPSRDRARLFQTSKQLSNIVLGLAEDTNFRISCKPGRNPTLAALSLAAQAGSLHLSITDGSMPCVPPSLAHCITTLELSHLQLQLRDLPLHTMPRLHTLKLISCHLKTNKSLPGHTAAAAAAEEVQPVEPLCRLQHLLTLMCQPKRVADVLLPLINPAALTALTTDDNTTIKLLPQLPNLSHYTLNASFFSFGGAVGAKEMQALLAQPSLTHVTLPAVQLNEPLSASCSWERLHLMNNTSTACLAHLQLAGLKSLMLKGTVSLAQDAAATMDAIRQFEHQLECQPLPTWMFGYAAHDAVFTIHGVQSNTAEHTAALVAAITAISKRLVGALCLSKCVITRQVLTCISQLPAGVRVLVLDKCCYDDVLLKGSAIARALPDSIQHIMIRDTPGSWLMCDLRGLVQNVRCFMKVTLMLYVLNEPDWEKDIQAVAQANPGVSLRITKDMC